MRTTLLAAVALVALVACRAAGRPERPERQAYSNGRAGDSLATVARADFVALAKAPPAAPLAAGSAPWPRRETPGCSRARALRRTW